VAQGTHPSGRPRNYSAAHRFGGKQPDFRTSTRKVGGAAHAMVAVLLRSPSSSGLGHRPFKAAARVRIPLGIQDQSHSDKVKTQLTPRTSSVRHSRGSGRGAIPLRWRAARRGQPTASTPSNESLAGLFVPPLGSAGPIRTAPTGHLRIAMPVKRRLLETNSAPARAFGLPRRNVSWIRSKRSRRRGVLRDVQQAAENQACRRVCELYRGRNRGHGQTDSDGGGEVGGI
jgi:hypothetical protein